MKRLRIIVAYFLIFSFSNTNAQKDSVVTISIPNGKITTIYNTKTGLKKSLKKEKIKGNSKWPIREKEIT